MFLEYEKELTPQDREIKILYHQNEKLKKEIALLKNQLESENDTFLIEISQLPEEQRNEFRDYKWRPHKRMLESRETYKN